MNMTYVFLDSYCLKVKVAITVNCWIWNDVQKWTCLIRTICRVVNSKEEEIELHSSVECKVLILLQYLLHRSHTSLIVFENIFSSWKVLENQIGF